MTKLNHEERKFQPSLAPIAPHRRATLPDTFDARKKWPKCTSIGEIRDQSFCGTCWAVSAASVLTDRMCITSNGANQTHISASNIAGCTYPGQSPMANCQRGGNCANAYKQATLYGVATGGDYKDGSKSKYSAADGCQPYNVPPGQVVEQTCEVNCWNNAYTKKMAKDDLRFIDTYWSNYFPDGTMDADKIKKSVENMKQEIFTNGPITIGIDAWSDFQEWEPSDGPYCTPKNAVPKGGHAMRCIGWDKTKEGKYYWLITNSWGPDSGDHGIYWIEMGKNCVGVESGPAAPIVKMPNTCGKLCDAAIDNVVRIPPTDPSAPVYAFMGNCTVEVTVGNDGKLTPKGPMVPILTQFIGSAGGPITRWYYDSSDQTWLVTPTAEAGGCKAVANSKKFECYSVKFDVESHPWTLSRNGYKYYFHNTPATETDTVWGYPNNNGLPSQYNKVNKIFTDAFTKVNALLDLGGTRMAVYGVDKKTGKGAAGVVNYSNWAKWETAPGPHAKC